MDLPRETIACLIEPGPASLTPGCTSRRHRQPPYPALFDTASHSGHGVHCSGPGEFILPTSLAFDSQSNLYVADTGNHRVQELDPDGRPLAARGGVHFPHGIAVDSQDDVYVSDSAGLRKFAPNGDLVADWTGSGLFGDPYGLAIDDAGTIFVADTDNGRIAAVSPTGD